MNKDLNNKNKFKADILLKNGKVLDVYAGEIYNGSVAIKDGKITGLHDCEAKEVIDLKGKYVSPGFIDSHVHIESSMCSPSEFSKAVIPLGTTSIVADPHEIANVHGVDGINYMLILLKTSSLIYTSHYPRAFLQPIWKLQEEIFYQKTSIRF